jgi:hypothetical protein
VEVLSTQSPFSPSQSLLSGALFAESFKGDCPCGPVAD